MYCSCAPLMWLLCRFESICVCWVVPFQRPLDGFVVANYRRCIRFVGCNIWNWLGAKLEQSSRIIRIHFGIDFKNSNQTFQICGSHSSVQLAEIMLETNVRIDAQCVFCTLHLLCCVAAVLVEWNLKICVCCAVFSPKLYSWHLLGGGIVSL